VGGNTTCLEVRLGQDVVIVDTGTGVRNLGNKLLRQMPVKVKILYTHVHWDHIQGLPFLAPIYIKGNEFDIYGGTSMPIPIQDVLCSQMTPPVFPVPMKELPSTIRFHDLCPGDTISGKDYKITLAEQNHPNRSFAYRFDYKGKSMVFCTDVEHYPDRLDENLLRLCRDTDLLIYDAQFTDDEYHGRNGHIPRIGWGHSTLAESVKMAKAANAGRLILFHHDPSHNDEMVGKMEKEAQATLPGCIAAYEGLEIDLIRGVAPKSMFK
jgi:phosphoribosyl 1,2-cyclic phosphodiesterase